MFKTAGVVRLTGANPAAVFGSIKMNAFNKEAL